MKKFIFLLLALIIFLIAVQPVEARLFGLSNKEKEELKNEIKEQVKEEIQDRLRLTGAPTIIPKETIKENIPFLLPAGINKATITEINGTSLPTTIKVIKESKTIILNITDKTNILRKFGGKAAFSEIHVGDMVSARGTWMKVEDTAEDILDVRVLRDVSIQKRFATFWGKVDSMGDNSFVLQTFKRDNLTVKIDTGTKIVNRKEETIAFADLKVGHRVRVSGIWDTVLKTVESVKTIKDWSLPPTPKVTVSPTLTITPQPTIKID